MIWIRRSLAVVHLVAGLVFLAGGVLVPGLFGFFNLLASAPRTAVSGASLLVAAVAVLPGLVFGSAMLVLAWWLWSGHPRLRAALLAVHACVLLLGALFIKWGFEAVAAAEHSAARGGGLLSPVAFLPFVVGVPLLVFALASIAVALWGAPPSRDPLVPPR